MSLKQYIHQKNTWGQIFGEKHIDINNLTAEDKKSLADQLSCDLSPENLCCDGELRGAPLLAKTRMLNGAMRELRAMGVEIPAW